jgi:hypothetical protein
MPSKPAHLSNVIADATLRSPSKPETRTPAPFALAPSQNEKIDQAPRPSRPTLRPKRPFKLAKGDLGSSAPAD